MIEYEKKLMLRVPLDTAGVVAELSSATPIADYFPPGSAAYFRVRFRVEGAERVLTSLRGEAVASTLTIKAPGPSPDARYEQDHGVRFVPLITVSPVCVKQRYIVTGLHLPTGFLRMPVGVVCSLDLVCTAWARPCMEIEGAPDLVDALVAQVAADAPEVWRQPTEEQPGPSYRALARILTASTVAGLPALWADQHEILSGRPSAAVTPWNSTDPTF